MTDYQEKMTDPQVGRNADLFAQAIGKIPTKEERYAYIRILIGIVEQAHQEWNQAPNKDRQVANMVFRMSRGEVQVDEVAEVVRLLDQERGYAPIPEPPPVEKSDDEAGAEAQSSDRENAAEAGEAEADPTAAEAANADSGAGEGGKADSEAGKAAREDSKAETADLSTEGETPRADADSKAVPEESKSDAPGDPDSAQPSKPTQDG